MSHSQGHMASGWQSGHGLGQLWTPCSQLEALTKPAPLPAAPLTMLPGVGETDRRGAGGLAAASTMCPFAFGDPGKQGLKAAPSPTCRGHLESGPGGKNVARALNKGNQQGQPGGPTITTVLAPARQGPRKEVAGHSVRLGPPCTQRRPDSQGAGAPSLPLGPRGP